MKFRRIMSILLIMCMISSMTTITAFAELENDIKIFPEADAYVSKNAPDANYGDANSLVADHRSSARRGSYMRFSYGGGSGESLDYISSSPKITLNLKLNTQTSSANLLVYGLTGEHRTSWQESSITYNSAISGSFWEAGELISTYPLSGRAVGEIFEIDVTDYVKSQTDGVFAFRLYASGIAGSSNVIILDSKESTGNEPYLCVYSANKIAVEEAVKSFSLATSDEITQSFELPLSTDNGCDISWESGNEDVISIDGAAATVQRPSSTANDDALVTLTATISKGQSSMQKSFSVVVLREGAVTPTSASVLSEANGDEHDNGGELICSDASDNKKVSLVEFDVSDDIYRAAEKLVLRLKLSEEGNNSQIKVTMLGNGEKAEYSNVITWNSAPSIIGAESDTTMSVVPGQWAELDVTSYVNELESTSALFKLESTGGEIELYGMDSAYKPQLFMYNYEIENDPALAVAAAVNALSIPNSGRITGDITLPTEGLYGTQIDWESSDDGIIAINDSIGTVTRPTDDDATVILTAIVSKNGVTEQEEFPVTVLREGESSEVVLEKDIKMLPKADAYVSKNAPDANYGGANILVADQRNAARRGSFMRFSYGSGSSESLDELMSSPKITLNLTLTASCQPVGNLLVYGLTGEDKTSWNEYTITFNSVNTGGLWENEENLISTYPVTGLAGSAPIEIDVTDYVKSQSDGVFAFKLYASDVTSSSTIIILDSKESTGKEPYLFAYSENTIAVEEALQALSIEEDEEITQSFELPISADNGCDISWVSDNEEVISIDGAVATVQRPLSTADDDACITLTATISKGQSSMQKSFSLVVLREGAITPASAAVISEENKDAYNSGESLVCLGTDGSKKISLLKFDVSDDIYSFASELVLRLRASELTNNSCLKIAMLGDEEKAEYSGEITWNTAPKIIAAECDTTLNVTDEEWTEIDISDYVNEQEDGVALFKIETEAAEVSLYGMGSAYKPQIFMYNYEMENDPQYAVNATLDTLDIPYADRVAQDLQLPVLGLHGATIEWQSSDESVIEIIGSEGKVYQSTDRDIQLELTAVVSRDNVTDEKKFTVTVLCQVEPAKAVSETIKRLVLDKYVLTDDGELPGVGYYGTSIAWQSSDDSIAKIRNNSYTLTRPANTEKQVTFKAVITKAGESGEKDFTVTVLRKNDTDLLFGASVVNPAGDEDYANDDDADTFWKTSEESAEIIFSMNGTKILGEFLVVPYNAENIAEFKIEISDDKKKWNTVVTNSNTLSESSVNYFNSDIKDFSKYVKISLKGSGEKGLKCISAFVKKDDSAVNIDDIVKNFELSEYITQKTNEITSGFNLPVTTEEGAQISWSSSSDSIVIQADKATVSRKSTDVNTVLTATISYNGQNTQKSFVLTVLAAASEGGGSGGGSGGGGFSSPSLPITNVRGDASSSTSDADSSTQFTDLKEAAWAQDYITALCERNIINGVSKDSFMPNRAIKREEFVKIIVKAFNLTSDNKTATYTDIPKNAWFTEYIAAAVENGIVYGYGDDRFGVGENITRQDIAVMLLRAINKIGGELKAENQVIAFDDSNLVSDYAKESIEKFSAAGILSGNENKVNPINNATRAETAKMVYMVMEQLGTLK